MVVPERLEGKSVVTTLREAMVAGDELKALKGFSSLLTHLVIEIEHGKTEYRCMIPIVYEKVGQLIYIVNNKILGG